MECLCTLGYQRRRLSQHDDHGAPAGDAEHLDAGRVGVFVVEVLLLMPARHFPGLIWARLLASALAIVLPVWDAKQRCAQRVSHTMVDLWRPASGAWLLIREAIHLNLRLAGVVFAEGLFYGCWLIHSWLSAGRPQGLEFTLPDCLQRRPRIHTR